MLAAQRNRRPLRLEPVTDAAETPSALRSEELQLDATDTIALANLVGSAVGEVFQVQYPQYQVLALIPKSAEKGLYEEEYRYRVWDHRGMVKLIQDYSTDFPRIDAYSTRYNVTFKRFGNSFGFNDVELRTAAKTGADLDMTNAQACRVYHEEAFDTVALTGVPGFRTFGVANHPNVPLVSLGNGDWANSATTPQEIIEDVVQVLSSQDALLVPTPYEFNEVWFSSAVYNKLAYTPVFTSASGSTTTILQALREMFPDIAWRKVKKLNGQGASTSRMIALNTSVQVIELIVGSYFQVLEPRREGMETSFPCVSSVAGVLVRHPQGLAYADLNL